MKKYDVTGIGNALVDIEFKVKDQFFTDNGVEKGLMTLVDEDRQNALMQVINTEQAKKQCGGSAGNTVIALAQRTMNTFLGITETYSRADVDEVAIKDSQYLYIEGYLITSENGKQAMIHAKKTAEENGVKVALTFSDPAMVKYFKDPMTEVIGASVDLLFANEEEAMIFTGKDNLLEAREELKKVAKHFVITQGKNGAMIYDGDTFIDIEPYATAAIDSNGAGDMFAGAFMYGITNGHSYASSGKLASMASSKIVSQFGPRLQGHEAKEILAKLNP